MGLPDSRLTFVAVIAVFAIVAVVGVYAAQGTFFLNPEDPCSWVEARHPDTNETYSSVSEFRSDWMEYTGANESVTEAWFDSTEVEIRDGTVSFRGSCSDFSQGEPVEA